MRAPVLHSVMFDPLRRAATPELKAAIKSLIAFLEQREADLAIRKGREGTPIAETSISPSKPSRAISRGWR